jgi:hypothetical protein
MKELLGYLAAGIGAYFLFGKRDTVPVQQNIPVTSNGGNDPIVVPVTVPDVLLPIPNPVGTVFQTVNEIPITPGQGVFWDEDFEDMNAVAQNWSAQRCDDLAGVNSGGANSAWTGVWPLLSNPRIVSGKGYTGNNAVRYVYGGHQKGHMGIREANGWGSEWPEWWGCAAYRSFPPSQEIWIRWMEYLEPGFEVDEIGTKGLQILFDDGGYNWFVYMWGGRQLEFGPAVRFADGTMDIKGIKSSFSMPDGQWVCYEARFRKHDLGQANGVYELFVNGGNTPVASVYDLEWVENWQVTDRPFGAIGLYVQDGMGTLYRDRIAVGTERIGLP